MPIESNPTKISQLNDNWPLNIDVVKHGAAHLRLIKKVLKSDVYSKVQTYSKTEKIPLDMIEGAPALNASEGKSGGLKVRLSGTTLYMTNNGNPP